MADADPVKLATWLVEQQLDGVELPLADFEDALGPAGVELYWQLILDRAAAAASGREPLSVRQLLGD